MARGALLRPFTLIILLCVATRSSAEPLQIDLTPERQVYEDKVLNRSFGLALLSAAAVAGVASAVDFYRADAIRSQLLAQQPPIDVSARNEWVTQGHQAQSNAVWMLVLGLTASIGSAYFLTVSF